MTHLSDHQLLPPLCCCIVCLIYVILEADPVPSSRAKSVCCPFSSRRTMVRALARKEGKNYTPKVCCKLLSFCCSEDANLGQQEERTFLKSPHQKSLRLGAIRAPFLVQFFIVLSFCCRFAALSFCDLGQLIQSITLSNSIHPLFSFLLSFSPSLFFLLPLSLSFPLFSLTPNNQPDPTHFISLSLSLSLYFYFSLSKSFSLSFSCTHSLTGSDSLHLFLFLSSFSLSPPLSLEPPQTPPPSKSEWLSMFICNT